MTDTTRTSQRWVKSAGFVVFAGALAAFYSYSYYFTNLRPGAATDAGWFAWLDQSLYLRAVQAFGVGNLDPGWHWYPPGYVLLATPFQIIGLPPFLVLNLLLLILTGWLFVRILDELGINRVWGYATFLIVVVASPLLLLQYVVPWSSTPATALLMAGSYVYVLTIEHGLTPKRARLLAAIASFLLITRPTDLAGLAPMYLHVAWIGLRDAVKGSDRARSALWSAAIMGFIFVAAAIVLHYSIYGFVRSNYMVDSSLLGLRPQIIPFRFYQIFISPNFYGSGEGIVRAFPPVAIGIVSLVYCSIFFDRYRALAIGAIASMATYLAYVDLLPWGLWRYYNIHYFKWLFVMMGLLTIIAARDLWMKSSTAKWATLTALCLVVAFVKYEPAQIASSSTLVDQKTIKVVTPDLSDFASVKISNANAEFGDLYMLPYHTVYADGRKLKAIFDFRAMTIDRSILLVFHEPVRARTLTIIFDGKITLDDTAKAESFERKITVRSIRDIIAIAGAVTAQLSW